MLKALIMAGGRGERFWPMSRVNMPKQCLRILDDKSMAQITVDRLLPLIGKKDIFLVTGQHLKDCISKDCPDINYVIEPCARDTAACIGLGTLVIAQKNPDAVIFIETTDHVYNDEQIYLNHIKAAAELAKEDKIVLIGIKPTHPHTGYGYIHQGKPYKSVGNIGSFFIQQFREKPQLEVAEKYVASGEYLWNSGMFIAKASILLDAIKTHLPHLHFALMRMQQSGFDDEVMKAVFEPLQKISIDYGIMEKASNTIVIRGEMHWDDIGDWDAMERVHEKDSRGNIIKAAVAGNPENCIIFGEKNRVIEAENVSSLIIVDTEDALLVCKKGSSQKVKEVVK